MDKLRESSFLRVTGTRYWKARQDVDIPAVVLDALSDRVNRSKLNLYLTDNYYRIVREDAPATDNPVLEMFFVATYNSKTTREEIEADVRVHDKFVRGQTPALAP